MQLYQVNFIFAPVSLKFTSNRTMLQNIVTAKIKNIFACKEFINFNIDNVMYPIFKSFHMSIGIFVWCFCPLCLHNFECKGKYYRIDVTNFLTGCLSIMHYFF